jgi:cytochrome c553
MLNRLVKSLFLIAGILLFQSSFARDLSRAKQIFETVCAQCHGIDGKTSTDPSYPKLAGQPKDYLAVVINDYVQGKRKNPLMAQQVGVGSKLSKQDLDDLAEYIASLPSGLDVRR